MEAKNNNAIEGIGASVSKAVNAFTASKLLKLWLFLGILAAVGIYFLVKLIQKNALNNIPLPELPKDGSIPDPETFEKQAKVLANELKDVITGIFTLASSKEKVFKKLFELKDAELIYTYRVYNKLYFNSTSETMTAAIQDESNYVPEAIGGVKSKLVNRLISLNCT